MQNNGFKKTGFDARNALRASGIVSDASEADAKTRTDGAAVLDYAPTRKDSGGNVVDAPGVKPHMVSAFRRQL